MNDHRPVTRDGLGACVAQPGGKCLGRALSLLRFKQTLETGYGQLREKTGDDQPQQHLNQGETLLFHVRSLLGHE